uniref:Uncharacterized protein n=1 Tax=Anguilla anguilla TaxID=7936 RepID=A0A0E9QUM0_ANGAN
MHTVPLFNSMVLHIRTVRTWLGLEGGPLCANISIHTIERGFTCFFTSQYTHDLLMLLQTNTAHTTKL